LAADLGRSTGFEEAMAAKRNGEPARRAFLKVADEILNPMTPDERGVVVPGEMAPVAVRIALVKTAGALRTKEAAQPLFEHMQGTNAPAALRAVIVDFLAEVGAMQAAEAVGKALADGDAGVRAAALPHLDRLEGTDALPVLKTLLASGSPVGVQQAAYAALAKLGTSEGDTIIAGAMEQLLGGTLAPELNLDVLQAADRVGERQPRVKELSGKWKAGLATDDVWRKLTLRGGDRIRGGTVFRHHPQVQCLRCHKVGGDGGTVGPALDGIGGKRTREYLLESILYPDRAYADGYRPVEGGVSAMPEGLAPLLTTYELRDVIEFLATLR
jgi:quinoprotein glucose dehydrogenase